LPAHFGDGLPYVRLLYKDESDLAGADADVEFERHTGTTAEVVVTLSEWSIGGRGELIRGALQRAVFSLPEGALRSSDDDQQEPLQALLHAVAGMSPVVPDLTSEGK